MATPSFSSTDTAFGLATSLFDHVSRGDIGSEVVRELLPQGEGYLFEKSLWDYKRELPNLPEDRKPTEREKELYAEKMAEIVKDVVSFYNSYGGYILAGIDDSTRQIVGYSEHFDCGDLGKKVLAATRHEIDCHYAVHEAGNHKVGLLFIPRRPYTQNPVQFWREAPKVGNKQAYKRDQIYFRQGDECKVAQYSEDFSFLCGVGRRQLSYAEEFRTGHVLSNNLGPRDPAFIKFIGREEYLKGLWRWLTDGFQPIKLLAGIGGVGKTTLAREFAEDVIKNAPSGFEKLVWLSAKKQFYTAILGEYQPTLRVDFSDPRTLLQAILLELGYPTKNIDPDWAIQELIDECVSALILFPSILVIDDVDSLEPAHQQDVFQTIAQITAQTTGRARRSSIALLTARLDLGAAPAQLFRVAGLNMRDFSDYVAMTVEKLEVPLNLKASSNLMQRFHKVTDGSPTFAASILRLVQNGEHLDTALRKWEGSDGEEVRKFAFKKELDKLSDSQIRTLYAACILGDTSFIELQKILQSGDRLLNDDIGQLRKYHLVALGEDLPGGARIVLPSTLTLVTDIIRDKVRDPKRIERECLRAKSGSPRVNPEVGDAIRRVTALWFEKRFDDALDLAIVADKRYPNNPDLRCLLGRAHLHTVPPDPAQAEIAFRHAFDLKCQRTELPNLWIKAKSLVEDWMGVVETTQLFPETSEMISMRVRAYVELGRMATRSGNIRRSAEQWLIAARESHIAIRTMRGKGKEAELMSLRRVAFEAYLRALEALIREPDEKIDIWTASVEAFNCDVRHLFTIQIGVEALKQWWSAVERRTTPDVRARNLMFVQLKKLNSMIQDILIEDRSQNEITRYLNESHMTLLQRANRYIS